MARHTPVSLACAAVLSQVLISAVAAGDRPAARSGPRAQPQVPSDRPELRVAEALRANPLTAPYPIRTAWKDGAVVLSGRVGTGQVHDIVVRSAIALGYPVRDDL